MTEITPSAREERTITEIISPGDIDSDHSLEVTTLPGSEAPGVLIFGEDGRLVSATANIDGYFHELGVVDAGWREGQELPLPVQAVLGALERSRAAVAEQERRLPQQRTRALSGRWLVLHAVETAATEDRPSERVVVVTPAQEDGAWFAVVGYELGSRTASAVRSLVRGLSTMRRAGGKLLTAGLRSLQSPLEHEEPITHVLPYWH